MINFGSMVIKKMDCLKLLESSIKFQLHMTLLFVVFIFRYIVKYVVPCVTIYESVLGNARLSLQTRMKNG